MALAPRLDLRQTQSLVMTPQLQQAIKLLALSNLELEGVLAEELAKNPLLDSGNSGEMAATAPVSDRAEATDRLFENGMGAAPGELDVDFNAETFHHDSPADAAWEPMAATEAPPADERSGDEGPGFSGVGEGGGDGGGEPVDFDSFRGAEITLRDHLLAQAGESLSGLEYAIAVTLIESIEESGYLDASLDELALRLSVGRGQVEAVLAKVQHFDPAGVGARSLSECIAIQAREADRYDPAMARLIDNLDMLAKGQSAQLRKMCGVDEEDWADMIRELRSYDPKPGMKFATSDAAPVVPDLFVRQTSEGWAIEINNATLPRVLINRQYYAELAAGAGKGAGAKDGKAWLADCLASANWLIKALDQRQQTIIKVAREIVKQQEGFFLHGVSALKPLTLRQVADAIAMHESTVSRVTSNKYLSCSRGMYELKYFFSSGIASADGEGGMSAEAIKSRIKALIDAESPKAILSDDTLVDLLAKDGCDIARRTVAKYREAMGIGSSVQRRRAKALAG
jgi:RNA polymerase sigma-54 factor